MNVYIHTTCLCKVEMYQLATLPVMKDVVITVVLTDITYICSTHITLYSNCTDDYKGLGIKGLLKRAICSPIALLQYKLYREAISWSQ